MRLLGLTWLLLCMVFPLAATTPQMDITYTSARDYRGERSYFLDLLKLSLDVTTDSHGPYRLTPYGKHMNQERQLKTLEKGTADIMWTMTTDKREARAVPVPFPLLKGYLGKRVFVIRTDRQSRFPADLSLQQLQSMLAVQGLNWPDTRILHANRFNVATVDWGNWYENLFEVIKRERGDYLPRSVIEAPLELRRLNDDALVIEQHHLLEYPAYMYFFVRQDRSYIAARVLAGLKKAEASGQFDTLFNSYEHHREADKLLKQNRKVHKLDNPLLSRRH